MTGLLLLLVAHAPLEVRVLEREAPVRVHLEAGRVTCDGSPLPQAVDVEAAAREVRAGTASCTQVVATGEVRVTVRELQRSYAGELRLSLQGGLLRLVNVVDVEDYLPSVLTAEADGLGAGALEAQAVVSRTFAATGRARHAQAGYHLCDLAHCQVYRGRGAESADARAAVRKTRDQVLLVGGIVLRPAFFHAACGGHTSAGADVFGELSAGTAVSDLEQGAPRCRAAEDFAWRFEVERPELARALGLPEVGAALEVLRRDQGGRALELRAFGRRLSGQDFSSRMGRAFGWRAVRSLKFSTAETDTTLRLEGTGSGHGVGLCQQGAKALAERGVDAKGILQRYFPESQVKLRP